MAALKPRLDLDFPRPKDGSTMRQHYEQLGEWDRIEELSPEVPPGGEHIWEWFWDIVSGKGAEEGFWSCLRCWAEMTGERPSPWETEVLARMNMEFQRIVSAKIKEK